MSMQWTKKWVRAIMLNFQIFNIFYLSVVESSVNATLCWITKLTDNAFATVLSNVNPSRGFEHVSGSFIFWPNALCFTIKNRKFEAENTHDAWTAETQYPQTPNFTFPLAEASKIATRKSIFALSCNKSIEWIIGMDRVTKRSRKNATSKRNGVSQVNLAAIVEE